MTALLDFFHSAPVEIVDLGTPVAFRRFGRGPAVVLVHGWPLNGATYRGLVAELEREFTCFVPDLPGAGQSPWDPRIRNILVEGGDILVRFADLIGLDRFALVGHDSGGTVARFAAATLGERVTALALTNTELPHHVPWMVLLYQKLAKLPGAVAMFRTMLGLRAYRRSRLGFGGCFGDRSLIEAEFYEACVAPMLANMEGTHKTLRSADFRAMRDLLEVHRRIRAPVVFVWGDSDPFFPLAQARALPKQFADARGFHEVAGARLFVHEEAPDLVARHILPLLRETAKPHAALAASA